MSEQIHVPGLIEAQKQAGPPPMGRTVLTIHDGNVVLHFERGTEYAVYSPVGAIADGVKMVLLAAEADPAQAQFVINCALAMVDHIYEQRGDLKPAGGALKAEMMERHRATLANRFATVLNSQRENKTKSNRKLAADFAGMAVKEILE